MHDKDATNAIHIRPAQVEDCSFIQSLTKRFEHVGRPPWRDSARMWEFHQRSTQEVCAALTNPEDLVLLAEDAQDTRLGFIYVNSMTDFFTGEPQAYLADIAVSEQAEGKGVAALLMQYAEEWARAHGFRLMALDVFALNTHARTFYKRLGYAEETLKLIKEL